MSNMYHYLLYCESCGNSLRVLSKVEHTYSEIAALYEWTSQDTGDIVIYLCPNCTEKSNEQAYQGSL